jgi:glycosyltransferase involved in cell wall biosynthesis
MKKIIINIFNLVLLPYIFLIALNKRFKSKKSIKIGIGPQPLINNIYHKKSLELYGYKVETFVSNTYYITNDFDIDLTNENKVIKRLKLIHLAFKYDVLMFYFNGGPLAISSFVKLEAWFYKLAGVKTILLPYGSDVQDMSRSKNALFKDVLTKDYREHKNARNKISEQIDRWTIHADYIISGCEWVDYMYHWDMLTLAHFSIDINDEKFISNNKINNKTFKIFHAPNHKNIKGTQYLVDAVDNLKSQGYDIELILKTKISNSEVIATIHECDIVADQFIVGWYAMFALEAMSCKKPVLCYLRDDLIDLYKSANILEDEMPIINTNVQNIKENILWCYNNKNKLDEISQSSYEFVKKYHSLESIGEKFDLAIKSIGGNK